MATEKWICADDPRLQYMGRIDWEDPQNPVWVYACTCVRVKFTGSFVRADITNFRNCWDNFLGVIIDGVQTKVKLAHAGRQVYIVIEDTFKQRLCVRLQVLSESGDSRHQAGDGDA